MDTTKSYENYPAVSIIISNLVSLGIYALGLIITLKSGWVFSLLYLVYIVVLELRLIRYHCTNCYYWGKYCAFGKGKLSAFIFKKGDISKFCLKEMTWNDMIPDILVSLVPLVIGIILLIIDFELILLLSMIILVLLTTMGNSYVRGSLACKYCKQRETGCPAERLFSER